MARDVMDCDGFTEATHAANLYVDNAARAQFNRRTSIAPAMDGFVKTDAGLELPLELGVEIKIVMR